MRVTIKAAEEHSRRVDMHRREAEAQFERERLERLATPVYMLKARNTRTGAAINRHSRDHYMTSYITEDGLFLALRDEAEQIIEKWRAAGELEEHSTVISGQQYAEITGEQ